MRCIKVAGARDLLPLARANPKRYPCLLESAAQGPRARWDILLACPQGGFALHHDGRVRDLDGRELGGGFLAQLDAAWQAEHALAMHPDSTLPFRGGWMLYLGYELAGEIESSLALPRAPASATPIAMALRCPAAVLVDREERRTWLVAEAGFAHLLGEMRTDLDRSRESIGVVDAAPVIAEDDPQMFIDGVERIHDYLHCGDTFQVNLSRAWQACYTQAVEPAALYAALRSANPAPFAGLLQRPGWVVASSSPERLLEVRGGVAQTRPIAGTRPRVPGDDDAARIRELIEHPKERAEHVMLIDLERNDLGRVCVPGSVVVDERMLVESYAHVHHIVSNVRGRLRADVTPGQVIAAVFPGGTITGCPKVRCMQIIAELEGVPRGAYTGALGYLNRDGDCDLNILIRTLQIEGGSVAFRAGAGIVADSDADAELAETRAKARGLLRALGVPA
ncbi:MAG TPA: aminodeoxychorismate synthase component I [Rhodanobacteraceae bacterium]|nr:aminodeoxychorismate synthase component I [Rhodanobacteraceae bacterium]